MDIASVAGLIIGIGAVALAFILEGGNFTSVLQLPAMILVIFGTIGAATVTTSLKTLINLPNLLKIVFLGKSQEPHRMVGAIGTLAETARREGLLGLEDDYQRTSDPFLKKALQLVIDGTDVMTLRTILETDMINIGERHKTGQTFFQKLGGFSPTLGIIGTVLGLINALSTTGDPNTMAIHIASAFIATLWGISLANLIYLPISDKLKYRNREEMQSLELIIEGMISIQTGDNPRVIKMKLLSFIIPEERLVK